MKIDRACPICKAAESAPDYAPFCSKRCADLDLHRWFVGGYAVPGSSAGSGGEGTADED